MFKNPLVVVYIGKRWFSACRTVQSSIAQNLTAKKDYYKKKSVIENTRPENWSSALPFEKIPGPKPIPLLGNTWRFLPLIGKYHGLDLTQLHLKLREEYGNIISLANIIGMNDYIFLISPDDIELLLRNEGVWPIRNGLPSFAHYRNVIRKDAFDGVGGLTTVHGEAWFKLRTAANPLMMQPRFIQQYTENIGEIADDFLNLVRVLAAKNPEGKMPNDFINELNKWSLESVAFVGFNKRLGCLDLNLKPDSDVQNLISNVKEMFDIMYYLDNQPAFWKYYTTPAMKKLIKSMDVLTFTIRKHIDKYIEMMQTSDELPEGHERSVLEGLLKQNKSVAVAVITDLIIGGIDSTTRTMGAILYFLAKHPEAQKKLHEEMKTIFPNKNSPLTKTSLANASYLKAVIKETLRLTPIAVGNLRTTTKDLVLCGYQIPKGVQILTLNLILSRMEENYPRPMEFIPERFLKTTEGELSYKNTHSFVYSPFGFGPRSCIGKRLANLELEVLLSKIVRNFKLSWPYEDARFESKIMNGIKTPLTIHFKEYDS